MKSSILFLLIVFPYFTYGQFFDNYNTKNYTDENGLSQNSVKSIAADKEGYLWLATEVGIIRYDGKAFNVSDKLSTGVKSNRIVYFKKRYKDDRIYALTDRWELIPIDKGKVGAQPLLYNRVFYLPFKTRNSYDNLPTVADQQLALIYRNFSIQTSKNTYYAISRDSVIFFEGAKRYSANFISSKPRSFFLLGKYLINCDQYGNFTRFDKGSVNSLTLTGDIEKEGPKIAGKIKVYLNDYNEQVFASLNEKLYKIAYTNGQLVSRLIISDFNFKNKEIESVYLDESNARLFLGSLTQGLFVVQQNSFKPFKNSAYSDENNYYAQYAYTDEQVLFSNGDVYGSHNDRIQFPDFNKAGGNISVAIDAGKNVWKMDGHNIYKFSLKGILLEKHEFNPGVTVLYIDETNTMWIGTTDGIYVAKLNSTVFKPELKIRLKGVDYQGVMSLARAKNMLWIGFSTGLYSFNLEKSKLSDVKSFKNKFIRSFHLRGEEVWVGTYGDGFYLYKDGSTTKMPLDEDKYLNMTHCIVEDKRGFFWISTNKGLFQVRIDDLLKFRKDNAFPLYYHYYDKDAGLNTNEFNGGCTPCGTLLKNGFAFLPSLIGPVVFNTMNIQPEYPDKELFTDKILVDGKAIPVGKDLQLSQKAERLEIHISSPYFGNVKNLHIDYKLAGDKVWNRVGKDNIIVFNRLVYGKHELLIRKLNGFSTQPITYEKFVIHVRPYYYQTWWFLPLVLFICLALIFLIYKIRINLVTKRNRMLELRVEEQTYILKENINTLKNSQYELAEKTRFQKKMLASLSHDLKSPLKFMAHMGKRLYEKLPADSDAKEGMMAMYLSSNNMYHFTDNLINYSKLFLNKGELNIENMSLDKLLQEKTAVFSEIALHYKTCIHIRVDQDIRIQTDKTILSVILHNLIDNAVKFCQHGAINIYSSQTEEGIQLTIADTGCGMSAEITNWINEITDECPSNGLGLRMVKEFTEKLNIRIQVETPPIGGTKIKLIFPS